MGPSLFNHRLFDMALMLVGACWIWFLFSHAEMIFGH